MTNINKNINQNKINEVEINSFIKEWLKNTNKELTFDNFVIEQYKLLSFYKEFLNSFLKNRFRSIIYGADIIKGFELHVSNFESLEKICKDIWDHPEDYYNLSNVETSSGYYYEFLKYLWVESDQFEEPIRLADIVDNLKTK
jgi:hypothetical protein